MRVRASRGRAVGGRPRYIGRASQVWLGAGRRGGRKKEGKEKGMTRRRGTMMVSNAMDAT